MPAHSIYLAKLTHIQRDDLIRSLWDRQERKCFICDKEIDLELHGDDLHIDHVIPIVHQGPDDPMNFALVHGPCNEKKGATNLEIARRLYKFEDIQAAAKKDNQRGANLDDILGYVGGKAHDLKLKLGNGEVTYAFNELGNPELRRTPLYTDAKSKMQYFFAVFPVQYLHHDDRINPRTLGGSLRGLMEEFYAGRPQLHVSLAWWAPGDDGAGPIKVFDGQHKAAAQILLGSKELPVRVFLQPDLKVLLQANTNAGDTLKQVAFDMAVKRHLGSSLYRERLGEYRLAKGLPDGDESFSEQHLVSHFKGSRREMQKYVLDAVRTAITQDPENRLMEYVELAGKGTERPLSYNTIEKTFFSVFLYLKPLETPLNYLEEQGKNPRHLEHIQMLRLMNIFAEEILVNRWDLEEASSKLEYRLQQGESVSEKHLTAHRLSREEILHATLTRVSLIIKNFFAYTGDFLDEDKLLQTPYPEPLWDRIRNFLINLRGLPCWMDRNLSVTVFGTKQTRDFWLTVFKNGTASSGVRVLSGPLDIQKMIRSSHELANARGATS
jgi:HNH endonuclease